MTFSCVSAALFAATIAVGAHTFNAAAVLFDAQGWSILAAMVLSALSAAYLLLAARDRILLRTGLWFGHVYAHHHLSHSALTGTAANALIADERSLRTIHAALASGMFARRMDVIGLPMIWLALAVIHPLHAIAAVAIAGVVVFTGNLFASHAADWTEPVTLSELGQVGLSDAPTATVIDAWEVQNRAAIAANYRAEKRASTRHSAFGLLTVIATVALGIGTAWLLQQGKLTSIGAAAAALLHLRHATVVLVYAADATARGRTKFAAGLLTEARYAARETAPQPSRRTPHARPHAVEPTFDVRHAA